MIHFQNANTLVCNIPLLVHVSMGILGQALVSSADVDCVNLTGSVAAARALSQFTGYKKLLFELGGNDPFIVMPDANLKLAAQQVYLSIYLPF